MVSSAKVRSATTLAERLSRSPSRFRPYLALAQSPTRARRASRSATELSPGAAGLFEALALGEFLDEFGAEGRKVIQVRLVTNPLSATTSSSLQVPLAFSTSVLRVE
jgi:hypothetical protein